MRIVNHLCVYLCILAIVGCSSNRLNYQNKRAEDNIVIPDTLKAKNFNNKYQLPRLSKVPFSYIPDDADALLPPPVAMVPEFNNTSTSVLLKDTIVDKYAVVTLATDSRLRPSLRTQLPIDFIDIELKRFLNERTIPFDLVAREQQKEEDIVYRECAVFYKLNHLAEPLFLCVQTTLYYVYIATQAIDYDDRSLDEEGKRILNDFSSALQ